MGGENKQKILASPIMQSLVEKGYEVLLFDDPIDEYAMQKIKFYEKKNLLNIGKGSFKVSF